VIDMSRCSDNDAFRLGGHKKKTRKRTFRWYERVESGVKRTAGLRFCTGGCTPPLRVGAEYIARRSGRILFDRNLCLFLGIRN
jgi:hypothetical protein